MAVASSPQGLQFTCSAIGRLLTTNPTGELNAPRVGKLSVWDLRTMKTEVVGVNVDLVIIIISTATSSSTAVNCVAFYCDRLATMICGCSCGWVPCHYVLSVGVTVHRCTVRKTQVWVMLCGRCGKIQQSDDYNQSCRPSYGLANSVKTLKGLPLNGIKSCWYLYWRITLSLWISVSEWINLFLPINSAYLWFVPTYDTHSKSASSSARLRNDLYCVEWDVKP